MGMQIGFIIFPNLTQLDFTGPLQVLHRIPDATTHILAGSMEPVVTDCGLSVLPTGTFRSAPKLDLLCVPGGFGVSQAITDRELMAFVKKVGGEARYLTSVCTGAFILGAAGLLDGKKATTHWAYHELLSQVGAIPTHGRVVRDGHIITGGGVTAGIDFAFAVVREVAGDAVAKRIQLSLEYRPEPPDYPAEDAPEVSAVTGYFAHRVAQFSEELDAAISD